MATDEQVMAAINSSVNMAVTAAVQAVFEKFQEDKKKDANGQGRMGDMVEKLVKRTENFNGENFVEWKFKALVSLRAVNHD